MGEQQRLRPPRTEKSWSFSPTADVSIVRTTLGETWSTASAKTALPSPNGLLTTPAHRLSNEWLRPAGSPPRSPLRTPQRVDGERARQALGFMGQVSEW